MKKAVFLIVMVLTCYIAGMYRNTVLLALAVLEFLLFLVLFFLPYYWKRVLQVGFLSETVAVPKGMNQTCRIFVKNKGVLAAGRFRIRVRFGYRYGKKCRVRMFGTAGGAGESRLSFEMDTPYCGLLELELERVRFYDYLSFFSAGKKQKDRMQLLVLPKEQEIWTKEDCFEWNKRELFLETWRNTGENEQMEVRQLREYQQGDDIRRIHWKQSARMQQLWVKEFERETDSITDLFLELAGEITTAKGMNCFYQITASVLLELMQRAERVAVHWFENGSEEICMEIWDFAGYQQLFCRLYQFDVRTAKAEKEKQFFWQFREKGQNAFRLNRSLAYYYNETLIAVFSEQEFL